MRRLKTNGMAGVLLSAVAMLGLAMGAAYAQTSSPHFEAAKKEGNLTVYTDQTTETIQGLIAAFKAKHPGINVDFYRGSTSQLIQRFETETAAGRHVVDVFTATERRGKVLMPRNLLSIYKSPELTRYEKGLQPDHGGWSVYALNTTSFGWNPRVVPKGQEPKEWKDLLDPKWKGKIGLQDPLGGGGAASWVATMYAAWGEAEWTDFMTKFSTQNLRYGMRPAIEDMVIAGELSIIAVDYPDFIEQLKAKGAPIEWGTPKPMVRTGMSLQLSAHAPHPNAGKLFIDFMLSDQAQKILAKLGQLPALRSEWPPEFARMHSGEFIASADELEQEKFQFFQDRMKTFFSRR